jgi:hypothetical protein
MGSLYKDSAYVENMRNRQLETANERIQFNNFSSKFKGKIENGYSLTDFARDYNITQADIKQFEELEKQVENEKEQGESFLAGFNSIPIKHR